MALGLLRIVVSSLSALSQNRCFVSAMLMLLLLDGGKPAIAQTAPGMEASGQSVEVQMRNVMYHFTDDVIVHIRKLHGELAPKGHNLPIFDDKESFTLQIASAEIAMPPDSLANVLNSYVFSGRDAPLKNISMRIEKGRLKVKGKPHSKGDIAFETEGQLSATPDGKIRMHTEKVKAIHCP